MKKILFVAFVVGATLLSCKKNNPKPISVPPIPVPGPPISINDTIYSTVKIGTQIWTSVNYRGPNGTNYNNSQTIDTIYGKLYTLAEAKAVSLPTGWHLPTAADVNTLLTSVGATGTPNDVSQLGVWADSTITSKLRSKSDWQGNINGNNSSGFNAYPGGSYQNKYALLNVFAMFWTNTSDNSNDKYTLQMDNKNAFMAIFTNAIAGNMMMSVRFVKDN